MGFITLLIAVTLSLAGSAAFFSIHGLAQIFTGAFWPVVIMATSLEAGKLIAASYTYRYWSIISRFMRAYLLAAIVVLMVITSAGIFGYLSGAYQKDMLSLKLKEQQIEQLQEEREQYKELKTETLDRKDEIDADIASLPNNYITARQRLLGEKGYGPELERIKEDLEEYNLKIRNINEKIVKLESTTLEQRVHTGPITFIAKVFNEDVDDTTKWLILLIIFAFDPLAVILTVGANVAIIHRQKDNGEQEKVVFVNTPDPNEPLEPEPTVQSVEDVDRLFEDHPDTLSEEQVQQMIDHAVKQRNGGNLTKDEKDQIEKLIRQGQLRKNMRASSHEDG